MKRTIIIILVSIIALTISGKKRKEDITEEHYMNITTELYRNPDNSKGGLDSLNTRYLGNWPFGYTRDTVREYCFWDSGGGVYIVDVSDSSNPVIVSDEIHTRGNIWDLYYDYSAQILFVTAGKGELKTIDKRVEGNI